MVLLTDGEIEELIDSSWWEDYKTECRETAIAKAQLKKVVKYLLSANEAKSKVVLRITGQSWQELVMSIDDKMYVV